MPTPTGARADHRLPLRPSEIETMVARARGGGRRRGRVGQRATDAAQRVESGASQKWVAAVANDLQAHRGASLVIAGDAAAAGRPRARARDERGARQRRHDGRLHADRSKPRRSISCESLRDLVADMNAGKVDLLVILGGNPVYTAPADLAVRRRARQGRRSASTSASTTTRRRRCATGRFPEAHFLEAWSDARAYDGTASIVQPLIAPLYGGKSAHELLAALSDRPERSGYDIVREYWLRQVGIRTGRRIAERLAARWLHDGVDARAPPFAAEGAVTHASGPERSPGRTSRRQSGRARRRRAASRSPSAPIPSFSTAASPTTAGCRSCRSRSPS